MKKYHFFELILINQNTGKTVLALGHKGYGKPSVRIQSQ